MVVLLKHGDRTQGQNDLHWGQEEWPIIYFPDKNYLPEVCISREKPDTTLTSQRHRERI